MDRSPRPGRLRRHLLPLTAVLGLAALPACLTAAVAATPSGTFAPARAASFHAAQRAGTELQKLYGLTPDGLEPFTR